MDKKTLFLACITTLLIPGCATPISPEKIAHADYGTPPPKNYKEIVRKSIDQQLFDPYSAVYEFKLPSKGYTQAAPLMGTTEIFGYRVCGTVNAKNRMGGYVGTVPFFVLFRDGVIVTKILGEAESSILNSNVEFACSR